jgi:hypothetical protein
MPAGERSAVGAGYDPTAAVTPSPRVRIASNLTAAM